MTGQQDRVVYIPPAPSTIAVVIAALAAVIGLLCMTLGIKDLSADPIPTNPTTSTSEVTP